MNLDDFEVGYNIPAKIGMKIQDIQTPALIIDYDIFQDNINKMKNFVNNNKVKLRPHAKMHKSVDVAKHQINIGGAHGICCQKVSEAEVFARNGIQDILITNQVTNLKKIERLTKIPFWGTKIGCCIDNLQNVLDIQNSAAINNTLINILVESPLFASSFMETRLLPINLTICQLPGFSGSGRNMADIICAEP